ncbi:MAG: AAA family ATPase [bacterium]|jgi:predicted ATPase|nr:AAA family ATPase [bacterium]
MIVTHLGLKNWRNFQTVDLELQERMFIVGPNAAGKSNLLDAFRFLRDLARQQGGGLQNAISLRGGLSKIRCLAARRDPLVEIDVVLKEEGQIGVEWRYHLAIEQEVRGNRQPILVKEEVRKNGNLLLLRPNPDDQKDKKRRTQTHLEQISANMEFRPIADFFASFTYLHLVPQLLRHANAYTGPGLEGDPFGRNFLDHIVKTPEKTRQARFKKIEKALCMAVPQLKTLRVSRDETGIPHLEALYEHWRAKGAKQREDQFSDGTLRLLALFWSLLDGNSLLLLEEPELSLNPSIIRKLPPMIYRLQKQKKRQVIISTHSADLLFDKGIGGEEIILLTPDKEGTIARLSSSIQEIRDLLESGISPSDAILPHTEPKMVGQLELFPL